MRWGTTSCEPNCAAVSYQSGCIHLVIISSTFLVVPSGGPRRRCCCRCHCLEGFGYRHRRVRMTKHKRPGQDTRRLMNMYVVDIQDTSPKQKNNNKKRLPKIQPTLYVHIWCKPLSRLAFGRPGTRPWRMPEARCTADAGRMYSRCDAIVWGMEFDLDAWMRAGWRWEGRSESRVSL